jgi:hypothetical protein
MPDISEIHLYFITYCSAIFNTEDEWKTNDKLYQMPYQCKDNMCIYTSVYSKHTTQAVLYEGSLG